MPMSEGRKARKRAYNLAYYYAHRDELKARGRAYYAAHKLKRATHDRAYYEQNRDVYRKRHWKYKYGLTEEQYFQLEEKQQGKCAICQRALQLCVDHCHKTGRVRGLLCTQCNHLVGNARDQIQVLKSAVNYLTAYGSPV